jgi:hypothetical protein
MRFRFFLGMVEGAVQGAGGLISSLAWGRA